MADAGEKKVKILILVPLITTALSMLTWLGISFLMLRVLGSLFYFLAGFSLTIGLVMAGFGTFFAMMENMNSYKVIGAVLIAVLLFTDIWLYNVLFSDHKPPEPRPVTTQYVESVTGDTID